MSVVVTGYGVVTPFGAGVETLMDALERGASAVRSLGDGWNGDVEGSYTRLGAPVPDDIDLQSVPRKQRRSMGRGTLFAQLAANEAVARAGLTVATLTSGRVGVAIGSTITSPFGLAEFFTHYLVEKSVRQVPANGFFRVMGNSTAANLATAFGLTGRVHATPAACASGVVAMGVGVELIRAGLQDVVLCGGEEELHPATTAIFDTVGAASTHYNDRPELAPAPFDRDRDGTVCGEGAGVLVLEGEEHARRRGAPILGRLLGAASNADGESLASPGVAAMVRCMRAALADAGLGPDQIDYVSAHGTGTVAGDQAEAEALAEVLGVGPPVASLKSHLGHTLGASGAIEAVACLEMMRRGFLVPTAKLRNLDPECARITHLRELRRTGARRILKVAFGFGGANGAVLLAGEG
jgi:3-oxoacyl-[acyl-carrier-protein] synthase II